MADAQNLWRHRGFRLLASSHAVSQIGTQISVVALPLLALAVLDATAAQIGLLTAVGTAGFLLVGLPAGVWVDRLPKRRVMLLADGLRALLLGSIPLAHLAGALTLPHLYAAALLAGIATVFFDVAYQSYLPVLIPSGRLVEGNTRLQTISTASTVAGPAAGGWLVRFVGAPAAVALDAVSFLLSALLLAGVRAEEPAPAGERRGLWAEMREGLLYLGRHPVLRPVVATQALANLFGIAIVAMLPVFFVTEAGVGYGTFGTVMAIGGAGGIAGAMTASWQRRVIGGARMLWLNGVLAGSAYLLVPTAAPGWRLIPATAGMVIDSFFVAGWAVVAVSFRQEVAPPRLLGRVNATARFVNWGVMPVGAGLGGVLAGLTSARTTLIVCGVAFLGAALPVLTSPLGRLRDLPQVSGVQT
ncbi:MFS transporter [Actinocorallia lasiicapitis]